MENYSDVVDNFLILYFFIAIIFIYIFQKVKNKIHRIKERRGIERESLERQGNIKKIDLLNKSIVSEINDNFILSACSRCLGESFILIQMNPIGNSIRTQCEICKNKKWIKSKNINKDLSFVYRWFANLIKLKKDVHDYFNNIVLYANEIQDFKSDVTKSLRKPIPKDIQDKVWNRDSGKCVQCGSNEKLEFDHIIPLAKGGSNTYRNIQLLCEKCNRSKGGKIG